MSEHLDIPIDQTSQIEYEFQAFALDGTPMDLTSATDIVFTVKYTLSDKVPFKTINLTSGQIRIVDAVTGRWAVNFPSNYTADWPDIPLVYDQYLVYGQSRYRASQGSILTNTSVTGI